MNETLKEFIENIFLSIEQTEELVNLKNDLLKSSNDKYNDLLNKGLSENEALGRVIAEFGSIEEILDEMEISFSIKKNQSVNIIELDQLVTEHNKLKKNYCMISIGIGLLVILIGVLAMLSEVNPEEDLIIGLTFLMGAIIPVAIIVFFGYKISKEVSITKSRYKLNSEATLYVKQQQKKINNSFIGKIIVAISLVFLALVVLFLSSIETNFQPTWLFNYIVGFSFLAVSIYLFITAGTNKSYLDNLLKLKGGSQTSKSAKLLEKISSAIMLVATIIFLLTGLLLDLWHIMWIVYPVGGLIIGIVSIFISDEESN